MSVKGLQQFESIMKKSDQLASDVWKATTAKRRSLIIPDGVRIFDTDLDKMFVGDGVTAGGTSIGGQLNIRKIAVNAAASGGLSASATTDRYTWTTYGGYLRTGDAVTIAAGTGTVPSGTSATTYWVIKDENDLGSDSFKIASSRANAVAGTAVNVLGSGIPGWTAVIQTVCVQGFEDMLLIDPVSAAIDVCLPYPTTTTDGLQVTVKRALAGSGVTIKQLAANGTVVASGAMVVDDVVGYVSATSGAVAKGYTFVADGSGNQYFTIAKVVS